MMSEDKMNVRRLRHVFWRVASDRLTRLEKVEAKTTATPLTAARAHLA